MPAASGVPSRWRPMRGWNGRWRFPGTPILHLFAGPFPRGTDVFHIRPPAALTEAERGAPAAVRLTRPRGYIGMPRDVALIDGQRPGRIPEGVPMVASASITLPAARLGSGVVGVFNTETVVGRVVPVSENRVTLLEMLH